MGAAESAHAESTHGGCLSCPTYSCCSDRHGPKRKSSPRRKGHKDRLMNTPREIIDESHESNQSPHGLAFENLGQNSSQSTTSNAASAGSVHVPTPPGLQPPLSTARHRVRNPTPRRGFSPPRWASPPRLKRAVDAVAHALPSRSMSPFRSSAKKPEDDDDPNLTYEVFPLLLARIQEGPPHP